MLASSTDTVATPLLGVLSAMLFGSTDVVATNGSVNCKEASHFGYAQWLSRPIRPVM